MITRRDVFAFIAAAVGFRKAIEEGKPDGVPSKMRFPSGAEIHFGKIDGEETYRPLGYGELDDGEILPPVSGKRYEVKESIPTLQVKAEDGKFVTIGELVSIDGEVLKVEFESPRDMTLFFDHPVDHATFQRLLRPEPISVSITCDPADSEKLADLFVNTLRKKGVDV